MGVLEKLIASQAGAVIEKTGSAGPLATWRVEIDLAASEATSDSCEPRDGYVSEVAAPDAATAIYLALMETAKLAMREADQKTVMRHMAEQIREQFAEPGEDE